jgi:phosphoribosylformylglycinamidine cyclo-ligase
MISRASPWGLPAGDAILGLASAGVHSNGFSLVRRIVEAGNAGWEAPAPFASGTLGEALMAPTRIYVKSMLALHRAGLLKAAAHITGGGLPGNVPRMLTEGFDAMIDAASWPLPPVFRWLARAGNVTADELLQVFNCGLGMVLVVSDATAARAILEAHEETVFDIGHLAAGTGEIRLSLPEGWPA